MRRLKTGIIFFTIMLSGHVLACDYKNVSFGKDFDGARLDKCEQIDANTYRLSFYPENEPINPSPWYAFSLKGKNQAQPLKLFLHFQNAAPRYLPKLLNKSGGWQEIPFAIENNELRFIVEVKADKQIIAAQALVRAEEYAAWMAQAPIQQRFKQIIIGQSTQKRDMFALVSQQEGIKQWFVVIGRQHPPEVTGAFALMDFVDHLVRSSPENTQFFEQYNVLIVPLMNPDGVASGHWRHNANGVDLNRDWGKFTQIETKLVHDYLQNFITKGHQIRFALDFHSTQQDIFYTMPEDYGLTHPTMSTEWIEIIKDNRIRSFTVRERPGSRPDSGVFKQYLADTYGIHSVTYEMGDNTSREMIRHVAQVSADGVIQRLLSPLDVKSQEPVVNQ